jgi:hypothetical protein
MADEAKSQVDNDSAAQSAANQSASTQAAEETFDAEYVRKLRAEAADYRKRLRDLEGRVKTEEETRLPEHDRLQKRLSEVERQSTEYQQTLKDRTLRYEVMLAANKLGIVDPDAAFKLLDVASLEFDEAGNPREVEKALKAGLKKKQPRGHLLFTPPGPAAGLPVEGDK